MKNQFSSFWRSSGILWIGHVLSGPISFSVLKSAQRGQYSPRRCPCNVAVVVDALHHVLDRALVARVGRADEEVVGDVDARDQRLEALRVAVGELLRRHALALGRLRDRLAVLVGAGEEEHLFPALAHVAREDVGGDGGVRVTQVRGRVDVEDRRGDVVGHRRVGG